MITHVNHSIVHHQENIYNTGGPSEDSAWMKFLIPDEKIQRYILHYWQLIVSAVLLSQHTINIGDNLGQDMGNVSVNSEMGTK